MLSSQAKRELKINQRRILIDSIEIGIPSSQQILSWAERRLPNGKKVGEIKNSKTVNYKKFTPLLDGLFCERIFGPVKSLICACGKKQPDKNMLFCEKCEVEYTDQSVRRYRLGYIPLLSSVAHIWYLKGRPSYLSIFLGKRKKTVMALAYCNAYLIEQAFSPIKNIPDSERRQNHGLELHSKSVKSFTRTRQFAANFYKSEKFRSNTKPVRSTELHPGRTDTEYRLGPLTSATLMYRLPKRLDVSASTRLAQVEVKLLPDKYFLSFKDKWKSKKANWIPRMENANLSPANLQNRDKTPILNSFLYLLTHILKTSQINSTTSISYAHYLTSVKESNKSIVKRKVGTILRKEEEKENQKRFKKCLQLVPNTLINLRKQDREIDPDHFSKSKKITLFSTDKLLANNDQVQDIKLNPIPIPSVPRTIGRKGSTINRKLFVQSFSAKQGLSLYTPEEMRDNLQPDSRIRREIANLRSTTLEKGETESNNELKKINQRSSQRERINEKNEKLKTERLEESVESHTLPTEEKLLCLLANTPEKGRNTYNRNQSLPFLPTLVCKYNLRDELLNVFNSSPLNEDIPIPLYCENKRWEPLQDVHKFMAEQSFSKFNHLKNKLSPQANSSLLQKELLKESSSSISQLLPIRSIGYRIHQLTEAELRLTDVSNAPASPSLNVEEVLPKVNSFPNNFTNILPVTSESSRLEEILLPSTVPASTAYTNFKSRTESRQEDPSGVITVKSVTQEEDIKSLRHILYKTFLKRSTLTIFNQSREEVSEWGVSRFADSKLILNPLFNINVAFEKANDLDQSVRTLQSYWKSHLLKNKKESVSPDLNEEKQVKQAFDLNNLKSYPLPLEDSLPKANPLLSSSNSSETSPIFLSIPLRPLRTLPSEEVTQEVAEKLEKVVQREDLKKVSRQSIKLKGLASHLKSNLEKEVNKSSTFSDLLSQNSEYKTNQLNLLKQDSKYGNTSKRYFTYLNELSFKRGNTSNKRTSNDQNDILINVNGIAKDKVYFFEKRLINTVYNSLVKEDLLPSITPLSTVGGSGNSRVVSQPLKEESIDLSTTEVQALREDNQIPTELSTSPYELSTSSSELTASLSSTRINASLAPFLILPERIGVVNSLHFHSLQDQLLPESKIVKFKPEFAIDQVELLGEKSSNVPSLEKSEIYRLENEEKYKKRLQGGQIKNSTTVQVQLPNGISQFLTFKRNSLGKVKESVSENLSADTSNYSNLLSKSVRSTERFAKISVADVNASKISNSSIRYEVPYLTEGPDVSASLRSRPNRYSVSVTEGPGGKRSDLDTLPSSNLQAPGKEKEILSQLELTAIREILSYTGGGALKQFLQRVDPQLFSTYLLTDIQITREAYTSREKVSFAEDLDIKRKILTGLSRRIYRNARRLKVAHLLTRSNRRPEWMMISTLPVLPPDLRPILQMSENLVVASDLNSLYQRVIYRNNRYYKLRLIDFHLVTAMQRLVQDAVDRLIENGKGGSKPFYTPSGRPLKSLSDTLKGKKGRFRLNLLGKRVDFSGRSVIVVSPHLKIHECGLPKEIALKLYTYFLLRQFMLKKQASSIVIAKKMIKQRGSSMWDMLRDIIYYHPLLLNRAPTLHRLGIQAFQPRLVSGSAILLHPLVCSGFNADFDGDQMGVHLPLSFSARAEAWDLLWSRNNLLSPATGQPVLLPSQDMVLGFYYMTASFSARSLRVREESGLEKYNSSSKSKRLQSPKTFIPSTSFEKEVVPAPIGVAPVGGFLDTRYDRVPDTRKLDFSTRLFSNYLDLTRAFQNGHITLHTPIWLKWDGKVENDSGVSVPLEIRLNTFGSSTYIYSKYKRRNDEQLSYLKVSEDKSSYSTIYTRTTVGRVLVNEIIFSSRQIRSDRPNRYGVSVTGAPLTSA